MVNMKVVEHKKVINRGKVRDSKSREPTGVKGPQNDRLTQLWEMLSSLNNDRFTGYIKINYSQGSIGRVEKFEEVLKNK